MSKSTELIEVLAAGWCGAPALCLQYNWTANTLRGQVSRINISLSNNKGPCRVQRKREKGVTFYRITTEAAE